MKYGVVLLVWMIMVVLPGLTAVNAQEKSMETPGTRTTEASAIMLEFARRTGLDSDLPPVRYLWTDAFAVCNFLGLAEATGEQRYRELALKLVNQVHHVLGRHRDDDDRSGWISGLGTEEGEDHPTRGGLRIGKKLPERGPHDAYDERMEWDRDGQYFHYLTRWMHALDQVSRRTDDAMFNLWARELATTSYRAFTDPSLSGSRPGMYWKMSIDLTRPLVPSMGQHDPLEGYITLLQLAATSTAWPRSDSVTEFEEMENRYGELTSHIDLETVDPLGIGGLLIDAWRLMQFMQPEHQPDHDLLQRLLVAATSGLDNYSRSPELQAEAEYRLAFRELGLAIGLHAAGLMQVAADKNNSINEEIRIRLHTMKKFLSLRTEIESFWRVPDHQRSSTWIEHRDINEVMLATSLVPEGFLVLTDPH